MLIVALGWSLLEAIQKSKTEHIMETDGAMTHMPPSRICNQQNIHQNIHSHHWGATVPVVKQIILAVISVLEGQCPLEWQFQTNKIVYWKISESHLKESKCTPLHDAGEWAQGRLIYFLRRAVDMRGDSVTHLLKANQTFLSCNPRDRHMMHFSLTGLTLWENMKLIIVETSVELYLALTAKSVQCR